MLTQNNYPSLNDSSQYIKDQNIKQNPYISNRRYISNNSKLFISVKKAFLNVDGVVRERRN